MRRVPVAAIMSTPCVCIPPDASIPEAVRVLRRHGISGVPVVDSDEHLLGMLTEQDILEQEAAVSTMSPMAYAGSPFGPGVEGRGPKRTTRVVADLMTKDVVTVTEDRSAHEVACLMVQRNINRIPVMRDEQVVGIVTRADVLSLFDRSPSALLAEAQRLLAEKLLLDPKGLDIVVRDGTIAVAGEVEDPRDIRIIEAFLSEVDGVTAVDTSALRAVDSELQTQRR